MEISKQFFVTSLLPLFKSKMLVAPNATHEIEVTVMNRGAKGQTVPMDRATFLRVLSRLMEEKYYDTSDTLDVSFDGLRYTVHGSEAISFFDKTSEFDLQKTVVIKKKRVALPVTFDEYPLKIRANAEEPVNNPIRKARSPANTYRLKKRYHFKTPEINIDMTIVKQATGHSFHAARVQHAKEIYEIEVEYAGQYDAEDDNSCMAACIELMQASAHVMGIMFGNWGDHLPKTSDLNLVFNQYLDLINKGNSHEKNMFIGPQPVALERRHMCLPAPGVLSVLKDYTVTDKADGLRTLLIVSKEGGVYMLDSRLNVTSTGMKVDRKLSGTVLDGEYITDTRLGEGSRLYMAFDVYFYMGRDVRALPLVATTTTAENRLDVLQKVIASIDSIPFFSIRCKKFYYGNRLLSYCKEIIISGNIHSKLKDDGTMPYFIDGLIFTPKYLPVGGHFVGDVPKDGTWPFALKWKPPKFNSIDFKVEVNDRVITKDAADSYMVATLLVGATDGSRPASGGIIGQLDPLIASCQHNQCNSGSSNRYVLRPFIPAVAPLEDVCTAYIKVDGEGYARCDNGDVIDNGAIVEFRFDGSDAAAGTPYRWKPMRVRFDKTRPNFSTVAASNWKSMQFPVTEAMMCGDETVDERDVLNEDDDVYYMRIYSRDKSATKCMLNFHNHWVKDVCIFKRLVRHGDAIMDIACGKGNDLPRWVKYKVDKVLGIDIVEENILNASDGAYARVRGSRTAGKRLQHAFITLDASKVIDSITISQIEHPSLKEIARSVWGLKRTDKTGDVFGMATNKFDLITCNFAVHYFFETETTLKNFCANVAKHIKGRFAGMCFDRAKIEELLKDVDAGKELCREKDGRVIWSIAKMYDQPKPFGSKISVFIETIGKKNVEFLVDFERLCAELYAHNIVLEDSGTFDELFDEMAAKDLKDVRYLDGPDGALSMSDVEKQFSFLNRWFIFKKNEIEVVGPNLKQSQHL